MSHEVFHVELDFDLDRRDHATFVILDALREYAIEHRGRAEDGGPNAEFLAELADTADRLHKLIDDQMCGANIREVTP